MIEEIQDVDEIQNQKNQLVVNLVNFRLLRLGSNEHFKLILQERLKIS
jgi:hypothetical protein